ncbi:MAG TPA: serine hydrolase domain-containing protein [Gemmatimonadota bacterium]|nr:serine hydrolase domain-containing protein [Gemmatimonadota bacterium]
MAPTGDARAFMRAAIDMIEEGNRGNTALVVIEDGVILAEYYSTTADPVDRNTVFSTASMSKWITAWGVMKLVEERKLDLDRPVQEYLTRWRLPRSRFDHRNVTTRRLLSHTAGLTDRLGFGDYKPGEALPTLEQSLAKPRASSGGDVAIAIGAEPGSEWQYSGGGYLILELLVEEVSGEAFDAFIERTILQPLGMTRSGYRYLADMENSAKSYDQKGRPATTYRYASKAATGFITSASDMAIFVLAQLPVVTDKPLAQATIDAMREPHAAAHGIDIWGLGTMLYAPAASGDFVFGHDGANEPAISASVRVNPDTNDGIVVLVTGSQTLASTLGSHWVFWQTGLPDFLSIPGEIQRVAPVLLGGVFVILLMAIFIAWRRQRAAPRSGVDLC